MLSGPLAFDAVATVLIDAVQGRLANTAGGRTSRAAIAHGNAETVAWDDCDCGSDTDRGLLVVAIGRQYGSVSFPDELGQQGQPGAAGTSAEWPPFLVAEIGIQVVRCASVPQPPATSVPVATVAAEARQGLTDSYELLVAATCALYGLKIARDIDDYQVRDRLALGPQGGCQGWQLNMAVSVDFLCPCP